jgi:hypothetical protein
MNGWKYILFEVDAAHEQRFRLNYEILPFPPHIMHADMAKLITRWKPVSAGFIRMTTNPDGSFRQWEVYGESDSLGLRSGKTDADFLNYD